MVSWKFPFRRRRFKHSLYWVSEEGTRGEELFTPGCIWHSLREALRRVDWEFHYTPYTKIPPSADLIVFRDVSTCQKQLQFLKSTEKEKLVLQVWEPPFISPLCHRPETFDLFSKVYTVRDDLLDGEKIFKFNYTNDLSRVCEEVPFAQKKLLTFFCANKASTHPLELYSERRRAIDYFDRFPHDFDLYGPGWEWEGYQTYKGVVEDKLQRLKEYRFALCYENVKELPGWITEKIFDCFKARCVPIYLGAPNISDIIPRECFIARDQFKNEKELYEYLKNMTEEEYAKYIEQAKNFLQSEQAYPFSQPALIDQVLQDVTTHTY